MRGQAQALERKIRLWILLQERKRLEQGSLTGVTAKAHEPRGRASEVDHRQITH